MSIKLHLLNMLVVLLLSGCTNNHAVKQSSIQQKEINNHATETVKANVSEDNNDQITSCQQTLDSLLKVNPMRGKQYKSRFDSLVNAAAEYASVRQKSNADIRNTVDAMYEYRTNKLCIEINNALFENLISRGDK